jgi:general secretion pathway protein K
MPKPPPRRGIAGGQSGFALLIVLWTLVLIAFLVGHLTATGRTEIRIAGNLAANAAAQAATDGAVYQAIFNLSDPRPERRWPLDDAAHELTIGGSRVTLQLEDEAARVNPNLASAALLEALIRVVAGEQQSAGEIVTAITEWVGTAKVRRTPAMVQAEYQMAGLDYGPPGAPLQSIDELARVRGMTPELLAALRPHLTLFGPAEPTPASSDPVVLAALAIVSSSTITAGPLAAGLTLTQEMVTVRIRAAAQGPGSARVADTAVVRIGPFSTEGYSLLAWHNASE